jgi:plastocyanin
MKIFAMAIILSLLTVGGVSAAERQNQVVRAAVGADGVQTVAVVGGSYFFEPNHIIVKVNVPVRLLVKKEPGLVPHNIVIKAPDQGIDVDEEMKTEEKAITFTPTETGTYKIYCSKKLLFFASHQEKGMEGLLEVVE